MRNLKTTGYIPYTGRKIVGNYLMTELKQDWRFGAKYFEELLVDHDACSNPGEWNFYAS